MISSSYEYNWIILLLVPYEIMDCQIIYVFMTKLTICGHYLIQFINAESHKHFEVKESYSL